MTNAEQKFWIKKTPNERQTREESPSEGYISGGSWQKKKHRGLPGKLSYFCNISSVIPPLIHRGLANK